MEPSPQSHIISPNVKIPATSSTPDNVIGASSLPNALLLYAESLIGQGQPSMAVVVAHTACEVATAQALSEALEKKNLHYLKNAVIALFRDYNLCSNYRLRDLYNALIGEKVQQQPFWKTLDTSVKRRNDIVHQGKFVTEADAQSFLQAAKDLVDYLSR
jgi:hypothetical protein